MWLFVSMTKPLPHQFSQYVRKGHDLTEARLELLGALALDRGLEGKTEIDLWKGLALAFAEDHPGWWYAPYRRGRPARINDPQQLYMAVTAVLRVVADKPDCMPASEGRLRAVVQRIGKQLRSQSGRIGVKTVCSKLVETEGSPWYVARRNEMNGGKSKGSRRSENPRQHHADILYEHYYAVRRPLTVLIRKLRVSTAYLRNPADGVRS
jgi:hypothetical protein